MKLSLIFAVTLGTIMSAFTGIARANDSDPISNVATLRAEAKTDATKLSPTQFKPTPSLITQTGTPPEQLFIPSRVAPINYIGIGGNFRLTGNTGSSFTIISKLAVADALSIRPSALLFDDFANFYIPLTYDLSDRRFAGDLNIAPYIGGGVAITTGNNSRVGPLLTAGVDIPLTRGFTANVATNLAFVQTTDFGISVGIAYNFQ